MRRWAPAAIVVLLVLVRLAPLVAGEETLYLRDVFNTHLGMKLGQAELLRQGELPLVDPGRGGGQPLVGNPNAVPLYPTNALYVVAPFFWAFNAHLWIHLLVAPLAMAALARAWGLRRAAAATAGAVWGISGYVLSQASFYNLVAATTLAPLLAALALRARTQPRAAWGAGLVWSLVLLGGDPLLAAVTFAVAASAWLAAPAERDAAADPAARRRLALAVVLGTVVAAPQLVELARVVPGSFRGHFGFSELTATVGSVDPRQAVEWLVPFAFGLPDQLGPGRFWGHRFYTDWQPFFPTLYPGLLTLVLVPAASWRGRASRWAWGLVLVGGFLALGRFNPLAAPFFGLAESVLRYPVKLWLPVAIGGSLLAGIGFERLLARPWRTPLSLLALTAAFGILAGFLILLPGLSARVAIAVTREPVPFALAERSRWITLALVSLALLAGFAALLRLARRRPVVGTAAIVALHAASQLVLLAPALATDAVLPYTVAPPALAAIGGRTVVHGAADDLFGRSTLLAGTLPQPTVRWLERRAAWELYPFTGRVFGLAYELDLGPEGLDGFLTRIAVEVVQQVDDPERVRLLAAWGVDRLLLDRPLAPDSGARLVATVPSFGQTLHVYALPGVPDVVLVGNVRYAPHLNAAAEALLAPGFDPRSDAVLPGSGPPLAGPRGSAVVRRTTSEEVLVETASETPAVLVVQRAHLPLWRATVDGAPAAVEPANLHRLGVRVPAGRHTVRLAIDRRPFHAAFAAAGVALALLVVLLLVGPRRRAAASVRPG